MTTTFQAALDAGHILPATWPDGSPLLLEGKQLYMASDEGFNLSVGRFHAFGDLLRRHDELKLTGELLDTGFAAVEGLFRRIRAQVSQDIEQVLDAVGEGLLVIERLRQRQAIGLSVEQLFEIGSIFYFYEQEDVGAVDWTLNREKIRDMMKSPDAGRFYSFFLQSPIGSYIPLAGLSDTSILNYLAEENVTEILDWTRTLLTLRTGGTSSELTNTIESRRETLYALDGLLHNVLPITTTTGLPGSETRPEN